MNSLLAALLNVFTSSHLKDKEGRRKLAIDALSKTSDASVPYDFKEAAAQLGLKPAYSSRMFEEFQNLGLGELIIRKNMRGGHTVPCDFLWKDADSRNLLVQAMEILSKGQSVSPNLEKPEQSVVELADLRNQALFGETSVRRILDQVIACDALTVKAETIERAIKVQRSQTLAVFDLCQRFGLGKIVQGVQGAKAVKPQFVWNSQEIKIKVERFVYSQGEQAEQSKPKTAVREEIVVNGKTVIFMADGPIKCNELEAAGQLMEKKLFQQNRENR